MADQIITDQSVNNSQAPTLDQPGPQMISGQSLKGVQIEQQQQINNNLQQSSNINVGPPNHPPSKNDPPVGQMGNQSIASAAISQSSAGMIQTHPVGQGQPVAQTIKPLLADDSAINTTTINESPNVQQTPTTAQDQESQSQQPTTPQKAVVTKVKLSDELNLFDWFRTTDIIHQIAEKAKSSVDTVITALDPGMKEYLYSGGNVNIIVISDSDCLVSPVRDAFQYVFGRATVVAARYNPPKATLDYPIKLACGFNEALVVAREKMKKLRSDTNNVPQNQVFVAIQPTLVALPDNGTKSQEETILPQWFLTYCLVIEDPVLSITMNCYSQFIPVDVETVALAKESKLPDDFTNKHLGFSTSIDELMSSKLKLTPAEEHDDYGCVWLQRWASLYETQIVHQLSLSLANLYKRKWNECVS